MKIIRLLLADDHMLIRDGLRKILSLEAGLKVIGEAKDGREALEMAEKLNPDVILMDINMPVMNGIEATKKIKEKLPHVEIIALTIHDDDEYIYELFNAGISGYILKDIGSDELIKVIDQVTSGESVFHPSVTQKLLGEFRRQTKKEETPRLTSREVEVLAHVTKGKSNKEIAGLLYISEKTVKNHLTNIFRKIDVHDRTQAALYAVKNRLVKL